MRNYYEMLGVSYTATRNQIKKAYLAMLKQYHPDIFKGNKQIAQDFSSQLNIAFDILSDADKRLKYDKTVFPSQVTSAYTYDADGVRVIVSSQLAKQKKSLPEFSFFGTSVVGEKVSKALKISKEEKKKEKKEKLKSKKLSKTAKKQNKKYNKSEKKQNIQVSQKQKNNLKQKQKKLKEEEKKKKKQSIIREQTNKQNKRKLDISILIIFSILIAFFGFMIYLNIMHS